MELLGFGAGVGIFIFEIVGFEVCNVLCVLLFVSFMMGDLEGDSEGAPVVSTVVMMLNLSGKILTTTAFLHDQDFFVCSCFEKWDSK